jgi:hypothetical protein
MELRNSVTIRHHVPREPLYPELSTHLVSHILPLSNPESNGYRHLAEFWLGQSDR